MSKYADSFSLPACQATSEYCVSLPLPFVCSEADKCSSSNANCAEDTFCIDVFTDNCSNDVVGTCNLGICPFGSVFENEKCITNASTEADYVNDGCNINGVSVSPPRFGNIESDIPVCGQLSKSTSEGFVDRDAFRFTVTSPVVPSITINGPTQFGITYQIVGVPVTEPLCPLDTGFGTGVDQLGGGFDNRPWSQQLQPGEYAIVIGPFFDDFDCGSGKYSLTLNY